MAAGSIVVDLLMRTGSFETDTARAAKTLKAFQKQVSSTASSITGQLLGALAAAGISFSLQALVSAAGSFKDLEEQTGATAESLASLAIVASVAGTSVADVAGQMNRLTKNLSGVDDESKAAGAALAALGIPIEEFKKLDPVGQIDALTKAFGGFADGSQKTAVAMALFGKTGAQMLSVFKELEASGGRQIILTQAQIELADDYTDRQKRLTGQIKAYAEAGVTDLLPALNLLTQAGKEVAAEFLGIDAAGKKLASESPVKDFADSAVSVLAFVVDAGQGVARIFRAIGVEIGSQAAQLGQILQGNFTAAARIAQEARQDIEDILSAELFSQRLNRLRAAAGLGAGDQSTAETKRLGRKPELAFDGAKVAKATKEAVSEAQRYLEALQKQIEKTSELTAYEQALLDIQNKRLKGITPQLERQILAEAQLLDLTKRAKEARDAQVATTTKIQQARLEELDAIIKSNIELQKEIDLLGLDEDGRRALELQTVRVTRAEKELALQRLEAEKVNEQQLQVLQQEIDLLKQRETLLGERNDKAADIAATDAAKKAGDAYKDALGDSIEQGILDGFRRGQSLTDIFINELKAQFAKTILRPIIQPAVNATNSAIADILKAVGGFAGSGSNTTDYRGTELPGSLRGAGSVTGPDSVDMPTILHKAEANVPKAYNQAVGGQGKGVVINLANHGQPVTAREESRQETSAGTIVNLVLDAVARDVQQGGRTHRAISGQYGLSRAAGAPKRA